MKSILSSIRAFVVAVAMVGFLVLCWMAAQGSDAALGALIADVGIIFTFYFTSATGAGGAGHGPTT